MFDWSNLDRINRSGFRMQIHLSIIKSCPVYDLRHPILQLWFPAWCFLFLLHWDVLCTYFGNELHSTICATLALRAKKKTWWWKLREILCCPTETGSLSVLHHSYVYSLPWQWKNNINLVTLSLIVLYLIVAFCMVHQSGALSLLTPPPCRGISIF